MADVQITFVEGETPQVVGAIPGPQGPAGAVAAAIDGSAALPSIAFASDTDTGLYRVGANQLGVSTGGTQRLVIDSNGQIEATSLGTAASPTWTFVGDPNTGIYSPGADQLALSTGGTGRLFVDASGNVGVGLSSPAATFGKAGSVDANGILVTRGAINAHQTNAGVFQYNGNETTIRSYGATAGTGAIVFNTGGGGGSADTERLRITSAGLVGIGTSSPSKRFTILQDGADSALRIEQSGEGYNFYRNQANGFLYLEGSQQTFSGFGFRVTPTGGSTTNAVWIDNSGRVGIGTTSPGGTLDVGAVSGAVTAGDLIVSTGSTTAAVTVGRLSSTSGDNTRFRVRNRVDATLFDVTQGTLALGPVDTAITFATNTLERGRWDSSGRLLVGTASSTSNTRLVVQGNSASPAGTAVAHLQYGSSTTNILNNYTIADLNFGDSAGNVGVLIKAAADANWGASSFGSRLTFSTTADGAASPTERMRIQSDGDVLIGRTSELGSVHRLVIERENLAVGINTFNGGNNEAVRFYNAGTAVGTISTTGSATAYNTSSDYRLKENVVAVTDGITRLQQLKPSRFNFIADPDKTVDGFIAHEVQTIVPEAITGEKDAVDDEGNPVYQGIDQSKLVPLLTAALQEALAEIESLKARVAALES